MPGNAIDNSERKEFESSTQAKSNLHKDQRCNEIVSQKFLLELYRKALLLAEKELNDYFLIMQSALQEALLVFSISFQRIKNPSYLPRGMGKPSRTAKQIIAPIIQSS